MAAPMSPCGGSGIARTLRRWNLLLISGCRCRIDCSGLADCLRGCESAVATRSCRSGRLRLQFGLAHSVIDFSLQIHGFAITVFALVGIGLVQSLSSKNTHSDRNGLAVNLSAPRIR